MATFQLGQKQQNLQNQAPYHKLFFLTSKEKLSKSNNRSKKFILEQIQFLQQFLHWVHFWFLWKAFYSPNQICSQSLFLTLYAMRFGRIYCSSRNIISRTGRQLGSHLTWDEMEEVLDSYSVAICDRQTRMQT